MAEKLLSPGVFTREVDLSFLPAAIAGRGPAVVGATLKGPAMEPVEVSSMGEFTTVFGGTDPSLYLPYTANEYFKNGSRLTVVRTLHDNGYKANQVIAVTLSGSYGRRQIALLHPAQYTLDSEGGYDINDAGDIFEKTTLPTSSAGGNAVINVSGSYVSYDADKFASNSNTYNISALRSSTNYIGRVFGKNPKTKNSPVYLYTMFDNATANALALDPNSVISINSASYTSQTTYSNASTPWIISQTVNNRNYNLFRLHTFSDGDTANYEIKIAISDVRAAGTVPGSRYGSFTLTVRGVDQTSLRAIGSPYDITDSDLRPTIYETYVNVTLDPNSPNYIGRVIGDQYKTFTDGKVTINGNYSNKSKYVYVEIDEDVDSQNVSEDLVPFGFASVFAPVPAALAQSVSVPGTTASLSVANLTASMWVTAPWQGGLASASATMRITLPNGNLMDFYGYGTSTNPAHNGFVTEAVVGGSTTYNVNFNTSGSVTSALSNMITLINGQSSATGVTGSLINGGTGIRLSSTSTGTSGNSLAFTVLNGPQQTTVGTVTASGGTTAIASNTFPSASFVTSQRVNGVYNRRKYWGFDYDNADNYNYLKALPSDAVTGSNVPFLLSNFNQDSTFAYSGSIDLTSSDIESRKFIVPFQGGFDGCEPNRIRLTGDHITAANTLGYDLSSPTAKEYSVYQNAIDILSNPDEIDFNLLVMPGVVQGRHSAIIEYASSMCQDRQDAMFVYDCSLPSTSIASAIESVSAIDDNYSATYYPWLRINDTAINKPVLVPPSTMIPGVFAYSDKVGAEWYAPAGLNRGALSTVLNATTRLKKEDRDSLYSARINPIATRSGIQGVVVWGQKTLQIKPSALDRINVRRLLIEVKKYISAVTQYLVFEQNNAATRTRFLNIVNPYLESIQSRNGLNAFMVKMDDENNTPDMIDRNILYGQLMLQPTKTAEFIVLDFNIQQTGASFDGI